MTHQWMEIKIKELEKRIKALEEQDQNMTHEEIYQGFIHLEAENERLHDKLEALSQKPCEDVGEISDGYHTFNQLYHQRAILFAALVNQNKDIAWKSYKHSDGKYCFDSNGEWFIVGIDTPEGSYTYHYSKEYWDYFKCKELDHGKEWDGHTEEDVTRLLSLEQQSCGDAISRRSVDKLIDELARAISDERCFTSRGRSTATIMQDIQDLPSVIPQPKTGHWIDTGSGQECSNCHEIQYGYDNHRAYCANCGAKMEVAE